MATTKINTQSYLWNMVPFDDDSTKCDDTKIENVRSYKMFPAGVNINTGSKYFDGLKQFKSPHTIIPVIYYNWTTSPIGAREDIPYIILKEKRLWKNNTFAKLIYSLKANKEYIKAIVDNINDSSSANVIKNWASKIGNFSLDMFDNASEGLKDIVTPASVNSTPPGVRGYQSQAAARSKAERNEAAKLTRKEARKTAISDTLKNAYDGVSEFIKKNTDYQFIQDINFCNTISNLKGPTEPYNGLYLCLNSGFEYILPYFNDSMRSVSNNWQIGNGNESFLKELSNLGTGSINILSQLGMTLNQETQGFYFEQSKPFQYPTEGDSFTVKFPLINTGEWADVLANWQFVFLLLFQNQPTRTDMTIIEPTALYEVEIPNMRYIPFAYIKNLKIEYKGTRRNMKLPVLKNNKIYEINTIIPEAWDITITLQGLTSEPTNFNVLNQNIITTTKLTGTNYNKIVTK